MSKVCDQLESNILMLKNSNNAKLSLIGVNSKWGLASMLIFIDLLHSVAKFGQKWVKMLILAGTLMLASELPLACRD